MNNVNRKSRYNCRRVILGMSSSRALTIHQEKHSTPEKVKVKPYVESEAEKIACVHLDALPYLDSEWNNDDNIKKKVYSMIQEVVAIFCGFSILRFSI